MSDGRRSTWVTNLVARKTNCLGEEMIAKTQILIATDLTVNNTSSR